MKQANPSEGTQRGPISRLVNRWIDRLFGDEDANAMAHGWQITRLPGGGRRYRDPRWDQLRCCEFCGGSGLAVDAWAPCQPCDGTGVIRSVPAPRGTEVRR